jgi:molybdenum-dependent DNA-binding transcriptional regulator ModE
MSKVSEDRRKLQKELAEHLREKDKAGLGLLRAQIRSARVERRHMVHVARVSCRTALVSLRERQAEERKRLTLEHQAERALGKQICATGKGGAKQKGLELEQNAKRTLKEERVFQRQIRNAGKAQPVRSTARERRQEDDDAVRSNLPAELVPVFEKHRKAFKDTAKRSRTEAFLEWAEENPDEILLVQQSEADRGLRELLKQQRELGRDVRNARRYKQTPEELAQLLAAVPF